jgi:hypothetical protein
MQMGCNKTIPSVTYTKFLGPNIDNTLTWKNPIESLINRFSIACYVKWSVKMYMSQPKLLIIYYALFYSVMTYSMIFWGNSTHSSNIFKIQKRVFRITMGRRRGESCRKLLKELKIFPLKSQYILSSLLLRLIRKATYNKFRILQYIY